MLHEPPGSSSRVCWAIDCRSRLLATVFRQLPGPPRVGPRAYRSAVDHSFEPKHDSDRSPVPIAVEGLDLGADDYLTKPFHLSELNARIKSIFRRRHFDGKQSIEFNEIKIDPDTQEVFVNGDLVILTKKEYELLLYLIANKNRVLTKQTIAEHLWGDHVDFMDSFDFVYQHIKNLRKKLTSAGAEDYLTNVYGMGYRFKENIT
jgi:DNA-binding response OmpR family regulator